MTLKTREWAVESVVETLEEGGYLLEVLGDQINVLLPDNLLPNHNDLLDEVRKNKSAFMDYLRYREFAEVPPCEGDAYEITWNISDEGQTKRWAVAARCEFIHLMGKVQVSRHSGRYRINLRCAMPLDWLEEDVTAACKREYNRVLERIHRGEEWLKANENDPCYDERYAVFLALHDDLRIVYNAVGELLEDPLRGYKEGRKCS